MSSIIFSCLLFIHPWYETHGRGAPPSRHISGLFDQATFSHSPGKCNDNKTVTSRSAILFCIRQSQNQENLPGIKALFFKMEIAFCPYRTNITETWSGVQTTQLSAPLTFSDLQTNDDSDQDEKGMIHRLFHEASN